MAIIPSIFKHLKIVPLIEHKKGIFNIEGQDQSYEQNNIIRISLRNGSK